MELCNGGCAEDFLRDLEGSVRAWEDAVASAAAAGPAAAAAPVSKAAPRRRGGKAAEQAASAVQASVQAPQHSADPGAGLVVAWTLQMAMSLFACKSRLNMVHSDVKLLNFMLTLVKEGDAATLRYVRMAAAASGRPW